MNWTSSGIVVLAESCSTCITPEKLLNRLGCTHYFNFKWFFNRTVLDMPVPAGIFAMDKSSYAVVEKELGHEIEGGQR